MLIFGLITIGVMSDNADDGMGMIILFGLFALLGIVFIIIGIRNIVRPGKTGYLKITRSFWRWPTSYIRI